MPAPSERQWLIGRQRVDVSQDGVGLGPLEPIALGVVRLEVRGTTLAHLVQPRKPEALKGGEGELDGLDLLLPTRSATVSMEGSVPDLVGEYLEADRPPRFGRRDSLPARSARAYRVLTHSPSTSSSSVCAAVRHGSLPVTSRVKPRRSNRQENGFFMAPTTASLSYHSRDFFRPSLTGKSRTLERPPSFRRRRRA